ncbi:MAG: DUF4282 domain-containing protein [Oscillospiraceae bacterium]|nr:DUF4282 domain-containing protein [Oscillospiraceae bacterium]
MRDFFAFRKMITPALMKGFYVIVAIMIPIGAIVAATQMRGAASFFSALGIIVGGELIWRLICERMILSFSVHEVLVDTRGYLKNLTSGGSPRASMQNDTSTASAGESQGARTCPRFRSLL